MEYENQVKALRCCMISGPLDDFGCKECPLYGKESCLYGKDGLLAKSATAIEELMAQVRDNDCLIQQQADEIERLRRDVKKQQEKMFELAKARKLKEMEEIKTFVHQRGAVIVDYDIYEMLTHNYGRKPKRGKWIDTVTAGIEETVCSVCRCSGFHHFKYCPRCGAMMEVLP